MKRVLLINQHSSNHGDEAAARALTARLAGTTAEYSMLYNASGSSFRLNLPLTLGDVRGTAPITRSQKAQVFGSLFLPMRFFHPFFTGDIRAEFEMIRDADLVISMPGGANLGLYEDWRYLWRLKMAQCLGKKTAIYSVSIGPFRDNVFRRKAFEVLRNADWVSLRDARSIEYGRAENLKFHESIDTAFLNQDFIENSWRGRTLADFGIPFEPGSYCVFVPNNLKTGHMTFRSVTKEAIDELYLALLNRSLASGSNVVMLPQLFGNGNDRDYFVALAARSNQPDRIFVASEDILSDHQQLIISEARFTVGARYHSIIFSINMRTPFLCLSYENKMKFTLERLGCPESCIDLTRLAEGASLGDMIAEGAAWIDQLAAGKVGPADAERALGIARETYDVFDRDFLACL